jgi:hypothetical protein
VTPGSHPLDYLYDAEVALEREIYAAERANTGCNSFAATQGIAIFPVDRRLAIVDLDPTVVGRYPGVVSIRR